MPDDPRLLFISDKQQYESPFFFSKWLQTWRQTVLIDVHTQHMESYLIYYNEQISRFTSN